MLFTILISMLSAVVYVVRLLIIKFKTSVGAKNKAETNEKKIPIVLYSDSKRYWTTFGPICDELDKMGQQAVYMTASPDDPALEKKFKNIKCEFIGEGNKSFAKMNLLNAGIVVSTTPNLDVFMWKRSKTVDWYVHVLHACCDLTLYRTYAFDYYDALLLSGDYQARQARQLEEMRHLPSKEIKLVGMPYLDAMNERAANHVPSVKSDKTTVLLSPSWGESSLLVKYGASLIDKLIATGYHIIIRPHPQSFTADKDVIDSLMAKYPDSDDLEWNRDNDNLDVLSRSDIMISDFSGIMYDFSFVFGKPVIYANAEFAKDPYDAWFIDEELWMIDTIRKIGKELTEDNINDIKSLIDSTISDTKSSDAISKAREETWCNIGKSSKLTAEYLVNKLKELKDKEKADEEAAKQASKPRKLSKTKAVKAGQGA